MKHGRLPDGAVDHVRATTLSVFEYLDVQLDGARRLVRKRARHIRVQRLAFNDQDFGDAKQRSGGANRVLKLLAIHLAASSRAKPRYTAVR